MESYLEEIQFYIEKNIFGEYGDSMICESNAEASYMCSTCIQNFQLFHIS